MYTIGNDYHYSDRLYEQQWDYPYILNISENPETQVMPTPPPVASPKDDTGQNMSENYTTQVNQNVPPNPTAGMGVGAGLNGVNTFLDSTVPGWARYKGYIIPAVIALAIVLVYFKLK